MAGSGKSDETSLFTYFYEHFLTKFAPNRKKDLGVFYTPEPVVNFMVGAVNHILQTDFGFKAAGSQGLANEQVRLLDFATGTGTFLMAALEQTFALVGPRTERQKETLLDSMLARFAGFELMVTPWVLAKYNLAEKIKELMGTTQLRMDMSHVYLTNTLETSLLTEPLFFLPNFSDNILKANELKTAKDIFVVLGNPPYNASSKNKTKGDENPFAALEKLLADYKPTGEKKTNINDDYVKFMRWAHHKVAERGHGVVAVITPHSFISGATYRTMRARLLADFDKIYVLDLHGNSNTKRHDNDQNVFNILTGVAITLLVKLPSPSPTATVYHHELVGKRADKFAFLHQGFANMPWQELNPLTFDEQLAQLRWGKTFKELRYFMPVKGEQADKLLTYGNFWGVAEIFENHGSGIESQNDGFAISFTPAEAEHKIANLLTLSEAEFRLKYNKEKDGRDWQHGYAQKDAKAHLASPPYALMTYRPFDRRVVWNSQQTKGVVAYPRKEIMQHATIENNIYLVFSRFSKNGYYRHIFVSNAVLDCHLINDRNSVAPLFVIPPLPKPVSPKEGAVDLITTPYDPSPIPNFTPEFTTFYHQLLADWGADVVTPHTLFAYIYGVLAAPLYQAHYGELLAIDYPRVWFTPNKNHFSALAQVGQQLIHAHTMNPIALSAHLYATTDEELITLHNQLAGKNAKVPAGAFFEKIDLEEAKLSFKDGEKVFSIALPKKLATYKIGSYDVLKTYLSARKERELGHYVADFIEVITAVHLAIALEQQLDTLLTEWGVLG